MEESEMLREQIFEIVNNQLKNNDPPETRVSYDRLKNEGFDDFLIKQMIGACVTVEIFDVIKLGKPFDLERYSRNLGNLPKEPFEDDDEEKRKSIIASGYPYITEGRGTGFFINA